jgi:hypothetical protein
VNSDDGSRTESEEKGSSAPVGKTGGAYWRQGKYDTKDQKTTQILAVAMQQ